MVGGLWLYFSASGAGLISLGQGFQILMRLAYLQAAITFMIVPLLVCDSIAGEKERETLELLMVTKLSPRAIIFEKFAAHFVSVAMLQLMAFPLMALTYPLGGVEVTTLIAVFVAMLAVAATSVGWAIFCSICSYTTQGALNGYLSLLPMAAILVSPREFRFNVGTVVAMYGVVLLTIGIINAAFLYQEVDRLRHALRGPGESALKLHPDAKSGAHGNSPHPLTYLIPVMQFLAPAIAIWFATWPYWLIVCVFSFLIAISTVVLLLIIGPQILIIRSRRAGWQSPSAALMAIGEAVKVMNVLTLHGVEFTSKANELPHNQPVAWRECHRFVFQLRTLIWCAAGMELILILIMCWWRSSSSSRGEFFRVWAALEVMCWLTTIALVATNAAGLFPLERHHQTLSVLLSTPLSPREIISQKMSGLFRMIVACSAPMASIWVVKTLCLPSAEQSALSPAWLWLERTTGFVTLLIFPSFVAWLGVYCGLRMKTRVQALVATVSVIATLIVVPWLLVHFRQSGWLWLVPQTPYSLSEWMPFKGTPSVMTQVSRVTWLGAIMVSLRFMVHRQFSHQVGRLE